MAKFKKFEEFLNKKKKDLINTKDGLAGEDYSGPLSTKPDQAPSKGKSDEPLPYKSGPDVEDGVVYVANDSGDDKGLAQHGSPGMTPKSPHKEAKPNVKKSPKPKRLTSEEFINTTKDMNDVEFIKHLSESRADVTLSPVNDLFGNEFTPDPNQTIQYVAGLVLGSPLYMDRFIREVKRRGGMEDMMSGLFEQGETYDNIIDHLEDKSFGQERCNRFAKKINDRYMKVFDNFDFGESVSPDLDTIFGGADYKKPDPTYSNKSAYHKDGDTDNMFGSQDMHQPSSGGTMGGAETPQFAGQPPVTPPKKMKEDIKFKGSSVGHNLINELSNYPDFKKHMLDRCTGKDC